MNFVLQQQYFTSLNPAARLQSIPHPTTQVNLPSDVPQQLGQPYSVVYWLLRSELQSTAENNLLRGALWNLMSENGFANQQFEVMCIQVLQGLLYRNNGNVPNDMNVIQQMTSEFILYYVARIYVDNERNLSGMLDQAQLQNVRNQYQAWNNCAQTLRNAFPHGFQAPPQNSWGNQNNQNAWGAQSNQNSGWGNDQRTSQQNWIGGNQNSNQAWSQAAGNTWNQGGGDPWKNNANTSGPSAAPGEHYASSKWSEASAHSGKSLDELKPAGQGGATSEPKKDDSWAGSSSWTGADSKKADAPSWMANKASGNQDIPWEEKPAAGTIEMVEEYSSTTISASTDVEDAVVIERTGPKVNDILHNVTRIAMGALYPEGYLPIGSQIINKTLEEANEDKTFVEIIVPASESHLEVTTSPMALGHCAVDAESAIRMHRLRVLLDGSLVVDEFSIDINSDEAKEMDYKAHLLDHQSIVDRPEPVVNVGALTSVRTEENKDGQMYAGTTDEPVVKIEDLGYQPGTCATQLSTRLAAEAAAESDEKLAFDYQVGTFEPVVVADDFDFDALDNLATATVDEFVIGLKELPAEVARRVEARYMSMVNVILSTRLNTEVSIESITDSVDLESYLSDKWGANIASKWLAEALILQAYAVRRITDEASLEQVHKAAANIGMESDNDYANVIFFVTIHSHLHLPLTMEELGVDTDNEERFYVTQSGNPKLFALAKAMSERSIKIRTNKAMIAFDCGRKYNIAKSALISGTFIFTKK